MKVVIIGCGYVGLTTGCCLAFLGHQVTFIDSDKDKIGLIKSGTLPIYEEGLEAIFNAHSENMTFYSEWDYFDAAADVVIIAVGTPPKQNGDADLSSVEMVAKQLGGYLQSNNNPLIVIKSTVPIGTAQRVRSLIELECLGRGIDCSVDIASNPEFLREGRAVYDTLYPERIIVGASCERASDVIQKLYKPILEQSFRPPSKVQPAKVRNKPVYLWIRETSAELMKYAANSFVAMKISFINEFARLSEFVGADITEVAQGIGLDSRIGQRYLNAGVGWGGSCFGKDLRAILHTASTYECSMPLVNSTMKSNDLQREHVIRKLRNGLKVIRGRTVGILGLSFKPNTDDLRDAPALEVIEQINDLGGRVRAYDPVAVSKWKELDTGLEVEFADSAADVFRGCHAVILLTEWDEFLLLPFAKLISTMQGNLLIDGRNVLDANEMSACGYDYQGIGRGEVICATTFLSQAEPVS